MMKLSTPGEFGLINSLKKQVPIGRSVKLGIGDDTAVVSVDAKKDGLLTSDMLIEGIHFKKKDKAVDIGRKAISASLSDIASMGGEARYALVSLGVNAQESQKRIKEIYKGMIERAQQFNTLIVGGDVVRADQLILNIAVFGEVERNKALKRSGAKAGDLIYVTGCLGNSLGSGHHLTFQPRLLEVKTITKYKPSAMIDISDGLVSDLGHITNSSRVGAVIEADKIPLRKGATLKRALYDGEDFELLFTLSKKTAKDFDKQNKVTTYCIGQITKQKGIMLYQKNKCIKVNPLNGYRHF